MAATPQRPAPARPDLARRFGDAAARWVGFVQARPRSVLAACLLLTVLLGLYAPSHLRLNTDEEALFSDDAEYKQLRAEFKRDFPSLYDPVVIVVEGETPGLAEEAAALLERALGEESERLRLQ